MVAHPQQPQHLNTNALEKKQSKMRAVVPADKVWLHLQSLPARRSSHQYTKASETPRVTEEKLVPEGPEMDKDTTHLVQKV